MYFLTVLRKINMIYITTFENYNFVANPKKILMKEKISKFFKYLFIYYSHYFLNDKLCC